MNFKKARIKRNQEIIGHMHSIPRGFRSEAMRYLAEKYGISFELVRYILKTYKKGGVK